MANAMLDARQEDGGYRRVELITGQRRRRRWTAEGKARIVAESFEEGANISEVARRHGVVRGLLTVWRRQVSRAVGGQLSRRTARWRDPFGSRLAGATPSVGLRPPYGPAPAPDSHPDCRAVLTLIVAPHLMPLALVVAGKTSTRTMRTGTL